MENYKDLERSQIGNTTAESIKSNAVRVNQRRESTSYVLHNFHSRENIIRIIDVIIGIFVRLVYIGEAIFCIYMMATLTDSPTYWFLMLAILAIIVDGANVILRRFGKEYSWY